MLHFSLIFVSLIRHDTIPGMKVDELIIRAQQGDKEAFGQLFKEYFEKIYRYCKVQMYQDELAADVAQETFLRAWKSMPSFSLKNGGTFQAYLFKIARNLIIDLSRKKKEYSLEAIAEIEDTHSMENDYEKKDSLLRIKKTLARLSETERQIIILRYFEELSHAEIARVIGIHEGALRVRTIRILHKLKEIIKKYG